MFLVSLFFATTTCRLLSMKTVGQWCKKCCSLSCNDKWILQVWLVPCFPPGPCTYVCICSLDVCDQHSRFSHSYAGNLDSIGLGVVGEAIRTFDLPKYLGHKYFIFLFTSRIEVSKVCFCSNLSFLTSCYKTWFKILQSKRNFKGVCSVWFSDCISASMLYADLSDFTLLLLSSQLDLFNPI